MSLLRRRLMMEDEDMEKWKYLGEATVEEAVNHIELEIPDDITEIIVVATNTGGDSESQAFSIAAWRKAIDVYAFIAGHTSVLTSNQRSVSRFRKITLESGEEYVDLISHVNANGSADSASVNAIYSGNMLREANGKLVGFRKTATANNLPVGFSFYVLGK